MEFKTPPFGRFWIYFKGSCFQRPCLTIVCFIVISLLLAQEYKLSSKLWWASTYICRQKSFLGLGLVFLICLSNHQKTDRVFNKFILPCTKCTKWFLFQFCLILLYKPKRFKFPDIVLLLLNRTQWHIFGNLCDFMSW